MIKPRSLEALITYVYATEISKMSDICYYPNISRYYKLFLDFYTPEPLDIKFKMLKNPVTTLLLRLIQKYSNNLKMQKYCYRLLALHTYGNLMRKHIRFCNPTRLQKAIQKLSGKHFFKKMGIEPALVYTADRFMQKYKGILSDKELVDMYLRFRTIIAQMVKALARRYYALRPEDLEEKERLGDKLAPILAKKIVEELNNDCLYISAEKARLDSEVLGTYINKLRDNIISLTNLLMLIMKNVERKTQLCSPIWMLSIIKRSKNRSDEIYQFLKSELKTMKPQLSEAIVRYILCHTRTLIC